MLFLSLTFYKVIHVVEIAAHACVLRNTRWVCLSDQRPYTCPVLEGFLAIPITYHFCTGNSNIGL